MYSIEKSYKIYDDVNGDYVEVCPDRDGLGSIEIRNVYATSENKLNFAISLDFHMLPHLIQVLQEIVEKSG